MLSIGPMAWLFEKSATWRRIVSITKQSPLAMAGFTATCFVGTYALGEVVMGATNPELQSQKEKPLRSQESMHNKASSCFCARRESTIYRLEGVLIKSSATGDGTGESGTTCCASGRDA